MCTSAEIKSAALQRVLPSFKQLIYSQQGGRKEFQAPRETHPPTLTTRLYNPGDISLAPVQLCDTFSGARCRQNQKKNQESMAGNEKWTLPPWFKEIHCLQVRMKRCRWMGSCLQPEAGRIVSVKGAAGMQPRRFGPGLRSSGPDSTSHSLLQNISGSSGKSGALQLRRAWQREICCFAERSSQLNSWMVGLLHLKAAVTQCSVRPGELPNWGSGDNTGSSAHGGLICWPGWLHSVTESCWRRSAAALTKEKSIVSIHQVDLMTDVVRLHNGRCWSSIRD